MKYIAAFYSGVLCGAALVAFGVYITDQREIARMRTEYPQPTSRTIHYDPVTRLRTVT